MLQVLLNNVKQCLEYRLCYDNLNNLLITLSDSYAKRDEIDLPTQ